jgi:hypothetical protein
MPLRSELALSVSLVLLLVLSACGTLEPSDPPQSDVEVGGRVEEIDPTQPDPWHDEDTPAPVATWEDGYCDLALFEDPYVGLAVGHPEGWAIDYRAGVIIQQPDPTSGTTLSFTYPALLAEGVAPEDIAFAYVQSLSDTVAANGGALELAQDATLHGTIDGVAVTGALTWRAAGADAVVWGAWAPVDEWDDWAATLMEPGECYHPLPGLPLQELTLTGVGPTGGATTFGFRVPGGWDVADAEAIDNAIMIRGDDAFVFYGFMWLVGAYTPDAALDYYLSFVPEHGITSWGTATDLGTTTDAAGYPWQLTAFDYEGYQDGPRHGVFTVGVSDLGGSTGVTLWWRETPAGSWAQMNAITSYVQASIQILSSAPGQNLTSPLVADPTQAGSTLSEVGDIIAGSYEYRNEVNDRLDRLRSESILGYETQHSPTLGDDYQMPYSAWDADGPQGPGYYHPDAPGELMEPID